MKPRLLYFLFIGTLLSLILFFGTTGCSSDDSPEGSTSSSSSTGGSNAGGTAQGGSAGANTGGGGGVTGGAGGAGGALKANGDSCVQNHECQSNSCVDQVCCHGSCAGICMACNITGSEGTCTPYDALTDPDDECADGACDGANNCAEGTCSFSNSYGESATTQQPVAVVIDGFGNIVITGTFEGTVNFGTTGDELSSAGGKDVFLAKFSADGTHLWSKSFGDVGDQIVIGVDTDVLEGIVISGTFANTINFGTAGDELNSAGGNDIFMAKFDADGAFLWSYKFGDAADQQAHAMVLTTCGEIAVTGNFAGTINFGTTGDELTSAGNDDIFFARFNPDGSHKWSYRFGDAAANQIGLAIATDLDGNAIVTGTFEGTVNFAGNEFTSQGSTDVFLINYDHDGGLVFAKSYGDAAQQQVAGIEVDGNYAIVLTGLFHGTINFGATGDEMTSLGGADIYLAKVSGDGSFVWSKQFGDATDEQGAQHALAIDDGFNIVLSGGVSSAVDFGGGTLTGAGLTDVYLAKFTAGGTLLYGKRFGDAAAQQTAAVKVDPQRNIIATGSYEGNLELVTGSPLVNSGQQNVFVAKFAP